MVAGGGVHGCGRGMRGCEGMCGCGGWGMCMVVGGACIVAGGGVRGIRRNMVNERAVRILLECILVDFKKVASNTLMFVVQWYDMCTQGGPPNMAKLSFVSNFSILPWVSKAPF